jgi:hypothetical protein
MLRQRICVTINSVHFILIGNVYVYALYMDLVIVTRSVKQTLLNQEEAVSERAYALRAQDIKHLGL